MQHVIQGVMIMIPSANAASAHTRELRLNRTTELQDSMGNFADSFVDTLIDKSIDQLLIGAAKVYFVQRANIDSSSLGTLGHAFLNRPALQLRSVALSSFASQRLKRWTGQSARAAASVNLAKATGTLQADAPKDEAIAAAMLCSSERWRRKWRTPAARDWALNRWRWRWRTRRPPGLRATPPGKFAAAALREHGVVRLNGVLSVARAALARQEVLRQLEDLLEKGGSQSEHRDRLGMILCRTARYDLLLQPDGSVVEEAMREALAGDVGELLSDAIPHTAPLHELAALVSDPGAPMQPIHPDTAFQPQAPLYTCFVALQDVNIKMGPTLFLPGTHTAQVHARFRRDKSKSTLLQTAPIVGSTLHAGDCAVYDSRLLHAGAQNDAARRAMLYFSFANPAADLARLNEGSIAPAARGRYTLADFRAK